MKPLTISSVITEREDDSLNFFLRDISKYRPLSLQEEKMLSDKIKSGDESAINKLVKHNLRFCISVAKQYQKKGLPIIDLIQEASIGMRRAAETFDADKGFKFISYAVWWMRQAIIKSLSDNCRTVRVPNNQLYTLNKISKVVENFEQKHGRKPSVKEIQSDSELSEEQIMSAMTSISNTISLDSEIYEDGALIDIIPNPESSNADENLINENLHQCIHDEIAKLTNREQDVIRMSFGIGMEKLQPSEIAQRFGVCDERIRQIIKTCIKKLSDNQNLKELL